MNFFSRQKAYVKVFAVYALSLMVFQNVIGPVVQFTRSDSGQVIASVEQVEASGVNAPSVYIDCDVNEDGSSLGYNNSYMCGTQVQCYGHVSNWNNAVGNNMTYTSTFVIAGGTLVPGSIWTYNDPAFNHGKPGSITCVANSKTMLTCTGTAGTDQDMSGAGEIQFESVPDMGFKVLLNACDNNCEDLSITASMSATLVPSPNTQFTDTHSYTHSVDGCSAGLICPKDTDYTATVTVNASTVTVAGTCDVTKFSNLSVAIPGQQTQNIQCTANRSTTFNNLAGNLTVTVTATPIVAQFSSCPVIVKQLPFSCEVCNNPVNLFVNAPQQTSATSVVITGAISGNWASLSMNGTSLSNIPGATIINGVFSVPVTLIPGQTTTFTFVADGVDPCEDKTVVVQISCNPTSCVVNQGDMTIDYSNVNGTNVTVGGYCDSSKINQVKLELFKAGQIQGQAVFIDCINDTWKYEYTNLQQSSAYLIRATSVNKAGCTGVVIKNTNVIIPGPVCTIEETDLTVKQPVVNGTSVTVGGTCNKAEYSTVKVELMMGSNVLAVQNVACSNNNTWTATFNGLTHNTSYTIRATTEGNVNNCTGKDVDTVDFSCGGPVCTDAKLTVNAPVQTSATSVLLTGTVTGSYSQVKVNGQTVSVNPVNGYFQATILLVQGQNTVVVEAIGIYPCKGDKVVKTIDCHTSSVCNHFLQTGVDITITRVTTNGMTGTIIGTYNSLYVSEIYVIYSGTKYVAIKTLPLSGSNTGSFMITIPGLPVGVTNVQVIATSLEGSVCPSISMPVSFTCSSNPVCTTPIATGDYTANVTTAGTTATIFGTYNVNTVSNVYVVYSGNNYPAILTNGTYSLNLPNIPVNSPQSAEVYFTAKDPLCPSPKLLTVNFTCNHNGGCNYPITDIVLNYASGAVVTTNTILLNAMVVGYGKEYNINGVTGAVVNGAFSRTLSLVTGANTFVIQVISQDQANCSPYTKTLVIYYQPTVNPSCSGLAFTALGPVNNTSTNDGNIVIQGSVNIVSGTKVVVLPTNAELTLTSGGIFSGLFSLNVGTQTFTVKAINASGCEVSQTITVTRNSSGGGGGGTIYIGGGSNYCGDGVKRSTEQCDDGNNRNGDGCDMNCYLESTPKQSSGSTTVITKKLIAKKLPTTSNTTLQLGNVIAPVVLPKTGGFNDVLTVLLQLLQSLIA